MGFCKGKQCFCIIQGLFCIFRISVLKIQIVYSQRCGSRCYIICLRLVTSQEECRTIHLVNFRGIPIRMINVAVSHLITMGDDIAICIPEGALHQVIIEITENGFNMVILSGFLIGIPEFIVAPSQCRSGIVFRHAEFYMISGIMETAGNINVAVSIWIQHILILCQETFRQVGCGAVHRHLCIIGMTVAAPAETIVFVYAGSAHIAVIKVNGILERSGEVDIICRRVRSCDRSSAGSQRTKEHNSTDNCRNALCKFFM